MVPWSILGASTFAAALIGKFFVFREEVPKLTSTAEDVHLVEFAASVASGKLDLSTWSDEALQSVLDTLLKERSKRGAKTGFAERAGVPPTEWDTQRGAQIARLRTTVSESNFQQVQGVAPSFRYAHKKTYATADPIKAAYFLENYFGARADRSPWQRNCSNRSVEEPITKNANFPATADQPNGFTIHFVKNPHKSPWREMNASDLGLWVEKRRGNFQTHNTFDQYMDNHLGLVFESLDPLVESWQRDGIPFICRTWCCGPGMPQFPDHCPSGVNTFFCEQGCYVEVPHGIIVEALCGLEGYNASRKCLTKVEPEELKIFDLCHVG